MREKDQQHRQKFGPLGVRPGIWLVASSLILLCLTSIPLTTRQARWVTSEAVPGEAVEEEPLPRRASSSWKSRIQFTPAASDPETTVDIDETRLPLIEEMTQDRRTWVDGVRHIDLR